MLSELQRERDCQDFIQRIRSCFEDVIICMRMFYLFENVDCKQWKNPADGDDDMWQAEWSLRGLIIPQASLNLTTMLKKILQDDCRWTYLYHRKEYSNARLATVLLPIRVNA